MESIRLNKFISDTGTCSRREADKLISQGRVTVNGKRPEVGAKVTAKDKVLLDGHLLEFNSIEPVYLLLNKPPGIETTTDLSQKDNIIRFVNYPERIFPVGRLDKDSEGLIILTNDGEIVNKILRAGNKHEKEYIVTVDKPITPSFLERMGNGVSILGVNTKKCFVAPEGPTKFRIILTQGMNRQIRRMCEALGYEVQRLQRIRIMHLSLTKIPLGQWRHLTDAETETLHQLIADSTKTKEASVSNKRASDIPDSAPAKRNSNKPKSRPASANKSAKAGGAPKSNNSSFTKSTKQKSSSVNARGSRGAAKGKAGAKGRAGAAKNSKRR